MAYLLLEDGTLLEGRSFGAETDSCGEMVFYTGMEGYQECLTSPACSGQIVVMTYPSIGSYGINELDDESGFPHASGLVVHDVSEEPSNCFCKKTLGDFLKENGIPGISGVDTRALTRKIRDAGKPLAGAISQKKPQSAEFDACAFGRLFPPAEKYEIAGTGARIAVLDLGVRNSTLEQLKARHAAVTVYPADTAAAEILAAKPDGVLLSSGPERFTDGQIAAAGGLLGNTAVFGIGAGCLLLALAAGCKTARLPHGHRGANQPVKNLTTGTMTVTSQYHSLTVDEKSANGKAEVTYRNWNDKSVEGIALTGQNACGVLFYPEPAAGPHDTAYLYDMFIKAATAGERN